MKTFVSVMIFLALISISAYELNTSKEVDNMKIPECELFSIHDLKIRDNVDMKEFENYVMNEIAPLYKQMKGQQLFLIKGYNGYRKGQYSILLTFDSIEDRDRIYPLSGGFSEEFKKIMEGKETMWDKFYSMADGFDGKAPHTDYVRVGH